MATSDPILRRIHYETDVFGMGTQVAETQTHGVDMRANGNGYSLATTVSSNDRLATFGTLMIAVKAKDGIFGKGDPLSAEVSSGPRLGAMTFRIEAEDADVDELTKLSLRPYIPARHERLLLPGDDGFELFGELHERLLHIGRRVLQVADMLSIDDKMTGFGMIPTHSSESLDPTGDTSSYYRMDYYELGTIRTVGANPHMLELSMNTSGVPGTGRPKEILYTRGEYYVVDDPNRPPYWREGGIVNFRKEPSEELDIDGLIAFSALGAAIQEMA